MEQSRLIGGVQSDAHTTLRYVAVHKGLVELWYLQLADARTAILYNQLQLLLIVGKLGLQTDAATLWGVFDSVREQVVENGLDQVRVERQSVLMGEWGKGERLILAGCHLAELVAGSTCQFDDVVLNHSQTLVTCVDTSELHQLVN